MSALGAGAGLTRRFVERSRTGRPRAPSWGRVAAARVNGMAMHVLDFEPMWNPPNHALLPLLPALLALAEQREREGREPQGPALPRGIAKDVEAQGRLRLASGQI